MRKVELFVKDKGFEEKLEVFQRGALVAQSPKDFESLSELSEADKEVIRRETTRWWSPKFLTWSL
jgi:hypothetical protein